MANEYLTMLDVVRMQAASELVPLIEKDVVVAPEWGLFPADTMPGTSFQSLVRTTLPTSAFRKANEGLDTTKSKYETKTVECAYLDTPLEVDVMVASAHPKGPEALLALEMDGAVKSQMKKAASQLYYGKGTGGDALGFPGMVEIVDSALVVDAGGTTAATGSSVYGIKFGDEFAKIWFGNGGNPMEVAEWIRQRIVKSSKSLDCWVSGPQGWIGAQWVNPWAVGRIKKLTEDSGKGLTDALLSQLLEKMAAKDIVPDVFLMTPRSRGQLHRSRTATSPTGSPPPIPEVAHGIKIVVTNAILNTEALTL